MSDLVCRGSWALGTACGRCSRCKETKTPEPYDPRASHGFEPVRNDHPRCACGITLSSCRSYPHCAYKAQAEPPALPEGYPAPAVHQRAADRYRKAIRVAIANLEASELAEVRTIGHVIRSLKEALNG